MQVSNTLATGIDISGVENVIVAGILLEDQGVVDVGISMQDTINSTIHLRDLRYFNTNLFTSNSDYNVIAAASYSASV